MERVKEKIAQNVGLGSHSLVSPDKQFSLEQVPDLSGKTAVVTGPSEGIGFAITHTLLKHNIDRIYGLSLRREKAEEAFAAIDEEFGAGTSGKRFVWKQCDLSDWEQTAKVAGEIAAETDKIDILINSAARGIMSYQLAPTNGVDLHMAANHMGHVVLTSHLLPTLKKTADSYKEGDYVRVVNMSSNLHESAPSDTKFASLDELNQDLGGNGQYARSKLANLLHARWLNQHVHADHPKLIVNATHPGIVDTAQTNVHIHEAYPLLGYGMSAGLKPFRKTQFEGAVSMMYAATTVTEGGLYICPPAAVEKGSDKANDMSLASQLMKLTAEIVEQKTRPASSAKGCPFKED